VARTGNQIPLKLPGFAYLTKDELTFYTKRDVSVSIEFVDGGTAGAEEVTVTGDDEAGYLISLSMDDGTSTATECKAALDADEDAAALIETVISGTAGNGQDDFAEEAIDGVVAPIGGAVRVHSTTGVAILSGGSATGAVYVSGPKTGVAMDGTEGGAYAYIDMGGGL
jgi:hypothetical protein